MKMHGKAISLICIVILGILASQVGVGAQPLPAQNPRQT